MVPWTCPVRPCSARRGAFRCSMYPFRALACFALISARDCFGNLERFMVALFYSIVPANVVSDSFYFHIYCTGVSRHSHRRRYLLLAAFTITLALSPNLSSPRLGPVQARARPDNHVSYPSCSKIAKYLNCLCSLVYLDYQLPLRG